MSAQLLFHPFLTLMAKPLSKHNLDHRCIWPFSSGFSNPLPIKFTALPQPYCLLNPPRPFYLRNLAIHGRFLVPQVLWALFRHLTFPLAAHYLDSLHAYYYWCPNSGHSSRISSSVISSKKPSVKGTCYEIVSSYSISIKAFSTTRYN